MNDEYNKLEEKLNTVKQNVLLAPYTSFNIGGPAKYFFIARNNNEIIKAIEIAKKLQINYFILGGGTNILVNDNGFDGLVIKIENNNIEFKDSMVISESGVKLQKLISNCIAKGLSGLEFLIGIPGTVGGGVAGNVGTPTQWIGKSIESVSIINKDGILEEVRRGQCDFSYRSSRFLKFKEEIILSAKFALKHVGKEEIRKKVEDFFSKRSHQPINEKCAGSVFTNPDGVKAWELIDKVGLRGKIIGGAMVSKKHANFIVNAGSATAEDVVILISLIKQQVRDKLGIQLQEEIKYIGY